MNDGSFASFCLLVLNL